MPAPPSSSGKITPISPISPSFFTTACGNSLFSSHSLTCGATSRSANARTSRLNCSCSSVSPKCTLPSAHTISNASTSIRFSYTPKSPRKLSDYERSFSGGTRIVHANTPWYHFRSSRCLYHRITKHNVTKKEVHASPPARCLPPGSSRRASRPTAVGPARRPRRHAFRSRTSPRRPRRIAPRHSRRPLQKRRRLLRAHRPRLRRRCRYHRPHQRPAQRRPPVPHRHRPQRRPHLRRRLQLHHAPRPAAQNPPTLARRQPHRIRLLLRHPRRPHRSPLRHRQHHWPPALGRGPLLQTHRQLHHHRPLLPHSRLRRRRHPHLRTHTRHISPPPRPLAPQRRHPLPPTHRLQPLPGPPPPHTLGPRHWHSRAPRLLHLRSPHLEVDLPHPLHQLQLRLTTSHSSRLVRCRQHNRCRLEQRPALAHRRRPAKLHPAALAAHLLPPPRDPDRAGSTAHTTDPRLEP